MAIIIDNISKNYGSQKALDQISLTLHSGEITGFIGPNGAGKSTLMKIITGYLPASQGSVMVDGISIAENPVEIKRKIGYLPENNPLYYNLYIKEYLTFVAGLYHIKNVKQRIDEVLLMTGLQNEIKKQIGALSKGYKQRVGLAQSLLHDPDILILDEPTSGLDPNQLIEIRSLIASSGINKTVLLSTHIMQEVEAICNRIIIIDEGKIIADDATGNIYSRSKQANSTTVVEFNTFIELDYIHNIPGVVSVKQTSENNYLIETRKEMDIREDLFNLAVAKGIKVLAMQRKEKTLEEVFRELTSK